MGEFNRARLLLWTYYLSVYNKVVQAILQKKERCFMAKKENSLAHTKWMCQYHIVFTLKYRERSQKYSLFFFG